MLVAIGDMFTEHLKPFGAGHPFVNSSQFRQQVLPPQRIRILRPEETEMSNPFQADILRG
jgi:hypothetical protein